MTKICTKCKIDKALSEFSRNRKSRDGLNSQCRKCKAIYKHEYIYSNRDRAKRHNMDLEILKDRLGQGCMICGSYEKLVVDHDHNCCKNEPGDKSFSCGKCVRGILCDKCNRGLGYMRDDLDILLKAVEYLKRPPLKPEWGIEKI